MDLVAETAALALYYHPETTEVAVRDKRSDTVWYSNPSDRMEDGIASPFEKEVLSSQLTLTFRDAIGTLETYPNYTWSVMNGNYGGKLGQRNSRHVYAGRCVARDRCLAEIHFAGPIAGEGDQQAG